MDRLGEDKQMKQRQRRPRISRRDFLGATAGAAGALGLAAGGVRANPSPARRAPVVRSQEAGHARGLGVQPGAPQLRQERVRAAGLQGQVPQRHGQFPPVPVRSDARQAAGGAGQRPGRPGHRRGRDRPLLPVPQGRARAVRAAHRAHRRRDRQHLQAGRQRPLELGRRNLRSRQRAQRRGPHLPQGPAGRARRRDAVRDLGPGHRGRQADRRRRRDQDVRGPRHRIRRLVPDGAARGHRRSSTPRATTRATTRSASRPCSSCTTSSTSHQVAGIAPADAQNDWFGPAYWAAFKANKFTMLWGPPWHIGALQIDIPDQAGKWAAQRMPTGTRRKPADRELRRHRPVHHRAVAESGHRL